MSQKESSIAFVFSIIGAILIIFNGLWIASNGSAVVIQSYPVSSVNQLDRPSFWGRVSFGIPAYIGSGLLAVWLIFAVINLLCGILLYLQPKKAVILSLLIIVCSVLSIPIGGGFIVGFLLGIIGGFAGLEWPKSLQETFVGRVLRTLKLDSSLFETVSHNLKYLRQAAWVLIIANALSGLGYGIYSLNVAHMDESADARFGVLLLGQLNFDISAFSYSLIYVGVAFIKWLVLSLLIYLMGTKLIGSKAEFSSVAAVVAFAYAPVGLQIFLPLVFSNQPVQWALGLFLITNIWMILALVVGVRQSLEILPGKAIGLIMLGGGIYWIINYAVIVPFLEVPGVWFILGPPSFVLMLLSFAAVLATLMGVFTRRSIDR